MCLSIFPSFTPLSFYLHPPFTLSLFLSLTLSSPFALLFSFNFVGNFFSPESLSRLSVGSELFRLIFFHPFFLFFLPLSLIFSFSSPWSFLVLFFELSGRDIFQAHKVVFRERVNANQRQGFLRWFAPTPAPFSEGGGKGSAPVRGIDRMDAFFTTAFSSGKLIQSLNS